MENKVSQEAQNFLNQIVGLPLINAMKSTEIDLQGLYAFGFGQYQEDNRYWKGEEFPTYILHVLCRFKVIWKNGQKRVDIYYEDTPNEEFDAGIKSLIGLKVKRVGLSEKNDLWLDFGDYWIVFATYENAEESWRLLTFVNEKNIHLAATDVCLEFDPAFDKPTD